MKWTDEDEKCAIKIIDAYKSQKRIVCLRGFHDDDKIVIALNVATIISKHLNKNTINLRTHAYKFESDLLQRALGRNITLHGNTNYRIFKDMNLNVDKWSQNSGKYGPIEGVTIYHPIQSVIADHESKDHIHLIERLESDRSNFVILVTTNDYADGYLDFSRLDKLVDEYVVLDSSIKYPDEYQTLLLNLNVDRLDY